MDVNVGVVPALSSMVTLNLASTGSILLAIVWVELPANSSPTGLLLMSTMRDPESPPALKFPGVMVIWFTNFAMKFGLQKNGPLSL